MHKAFHYSLLKQFAVGEGVEPSKEILNQQKLIFYFISDAYGFGLHNYIGTKV